MGQHDRGQPRLVAVGNAVQEHLASVLAFHSVVNGICLGVGDVWKQMVALNSCLIGDLENEIGEVAVERGSGSRARVRSTSSPRLPRRKVSMSWS